VFALILYEVISGAVRHGRERKTQTFLNEQRDSLSGFIAPGESLKVCLPGMDGTPWQTRQYEEKRNTWTADVNAWVSSTAEAIGQRSARARSAFMSITNTSYAPGIAWKSDGTVWNFHEDTAASFRKLTEHLDNLQRMIASPESYF
jgi:hypothetical protein